MLVFATAHRDFLSVDDQDIGGGREIFPAQAGGCGKNHASARRQLVVEHAQRLGLHEIGAQGARGSRGGRDGGHHLCDALRRHRRLRSAQRAATQQQNATEGAERRKNLHSNGDKEGKGEKPLARRNTMTRNFCRHTARTADDRRHLRGENGEVFEKSGALWRENGAFSSEHPPLFDRRAPCAETHSPAFAAFQRVVSQTPNTMQAQPTQRRGGTCSSKTNTAAKRANT